MIPDPSLLCHPNIPKPLHGLAPRAILGEEWWQETRRLTIEQQDGRCAACGALKDEVEGENKWLECHEVYTYDYERGIATFETVVALCPYCHKFIHSGRLSMLLNAGKISRKECDLIRASRFKMLDDAGLIERWKSRHDHGGTSAPFHEWKLIVGNDEYPARFKSYEEWAEYYRGERDGN